MPLHLDNLVDRGDPKLGDRLDIDAFVVRGLRHLDILVAHLRQQIADEPLEGIGVHVLQPLAEHVPLGSVEGLNRSEEFPGTVLPRVGQP